MKSSGLVVSCVVKQGLELPTTAIEVLPGSGLTIQGSQSRNLRTLRLWDEGQLFHITCDGRFNLCQDQSPQELFQRLLQLLFLCLNCRVCLCQLIDRYLKWWIFFTRLQSCATLQANLSCEAVSIPYWAKSFALCRAQNWDDRPQFWTYHIWTFFSWNSDIYNSNVWRIHNR